MMRHDDFDEMLHISEYTRPTFNIHPKIQSKQKCGTFINIFCLKHNINLQFKNALFKKKHFSYNPIKIGVFPGKM